MGGGGGGGVRVRVGGGEEGGREGGREGKKKKAPTALTPTALMPLQP